MYLAEAAPQPLPGHIKPAVLEALTAIGDRLRTEQYLDFLRCRIFRRTLLCRAGQSPSLDGATARLTAFSVSSEARPETESPDPAPALYREQSPSLSH